ncbi:MAG: RtcB family protein [Candidatus Zixiibacteriota bacterium]|nr:MAG: RtcB family protein [candidate division Zixibacteria bacterium]
MAWKGPIDKLDANRFQIPASYQSQTMKQHGVRMSVPAVIYADDRMLQAIIRDDSPEQVANVATLPGIVGRSIAMPDIHHGYGFAIGGVAAFDSQSGIISPGGVGYDINCGVRLLRTDLTVPDVKKHIEKLVNTMFSNIPCGVGSEGKVHLSPADMNRVLEDGARWAVENGYGWAEDLTFTEESGSIEGAEANVVSDAARKRGSRQLGTLGAGNHFLEIQRVEEIYDTVVAEAFGITAVDQITVMIHTGSRGCGHQICTDYLELMRRANKKYNIPLIDRELSCAPATSPEGQQYFTAMKCGANFAWANRQMITHWVRESFESVLGQSSQSMGLRQIYDIAHNIAKLEEHEFEGKNRWLYVHRKGATRSFGPGHKDIPERYHGVGQPVLIPGDMGTASYLLVGTEQAMRDTFGSSCHGAGRSLSRHAARKQHPPGKVFSDLERKGIYLQAKSRKVISEEAPEAYKNIDEVVEISDRAGIARKVARMKPLGVVKG